MGSMPKRRPILERILPKKAVREIRAHQISRQRAPETVDEIARQLAAKREKLAEEEKKSPWLDEQYEIYLRAADKQSFMSRKRIAKARQRDVLARAKLMAKAKKKIKQQEKDLKEAP